MNVKLWKTVKAQCRLKRHDRLKAAPNLKVSTDDSSMYTHVLSNHCAKVSDATSIEGFVVHETTSL